MNIKIESKGDFHDIEAWLDSVAKRNPSKALDQIASEGEKSLASNTPRDTGKTASGWVADIETKGSISEISWKNTAHPDLNVNLALLIEQGHGTGTGGYVPPRPYIKKSMDSVFQTAGDKVVKELID